jgi:hypothetical protein
MRRCSRIVGACSRKFTQRAGGGGTFSPWRTERGKISSLKTIFCRGATANLISFQSRARRQTLQNQFKSLDFSIDPRRPCNQYDLITPELDGANEI